MPNFHDFLFRTLQGIDPQLSVPDHPKAKSDFFAISLPEMAFDYFSNLPAVEKFDALIVDEGQDFHEEWYLWLRSMLKENGYFYIFVDPGQSVYQTDSAFLKKLPHSKHRLAQNLRNTEAINKWIYENFPQDGVLKARLPGGLPVSVFSWRDPEEEKRLIEKEIGRLIIQGIRPQRITIFLIGLREWNYACTPADIYVGASRARYLLHVFHHQDFSIKQAKI